MAQSDAADLQRLIERTSSEVRRRPGRWQDLEERQIAYVHEHGTEHRVDDATGELARQAITDIALIGQLVGRVARLEAEVQALRGVHGG